MSKQIIDIPTRVSLIPYKQPCKNVRINENGDIEWVPGRSQEIKDDELDEFINDTAEFVRVLGVDLIQSLAKKTINHCDRLPLILISHYYKKWGAFTKSKDNKVSLLDLCRSCYTVIVSLNLWTQSSVLNDLKIYLNPDNHIIYKDKGKINSWYAGYVYNYDRDWLWLPETNAVKYSGYSAYNLRIRQPSKKRYDEEYRNKEEELNKYIKNEVVTSISKYMSSQLDTGVHSVKFERGYFSFNFIVKNRLLTYLMYNLPELLREEIKMCECGCGDTVIGNRKFLPGHIEKKRNSQSDRKVKAWIRVNKNRGNITQEQYEKLSAVVDKEYQKGMNVDEIRNTIQNLLEEGE